MYALAEELDYPDLKIGTLADLMWHLMVTRNRPGSQLKRFVDAAFAPLGTTARICKDEDGAPQNLAVAAVIAHELKDWLGSVGKEARKDFVESIQGPEYAGFWTAYHAVKEQSKDPLGKVEATRAAADKRQMQLKRGRQE